jgi:hypothetical protein
VAGEGLLALVVAVPAHGDRLDEGRALPRAAALDGALGRRPDGEDVVAVDLLARDLHGPAALVDAPEVSFSVGVHSV